MSYLSAPDGEPLLAISANRIARLADPADDGLSSPVETYQRVVLWLVGASVLIAGAMTIGLKFSVELTGAGFWTQLIAAAMISARIVRRNPMQSRIADTLGTLAFVWFAGLNCGLISLMGLHVHMPLADRSLLSLDRAIGVNGVAIIGWIADQPPWLLSAMGAAYSFTIPVVFVSMGLLSMIGERVEAWRAAFCFIGTLFCVSLISIVTPAKGIGIWASSALMTSLPDGWACYFWRSFDEFYLGASPVLRVESLSGVVSFPSFHTVMGLITLAMWRKRPMMLALVSAWFLPMLAATIPVGGHYLVDVLAGVALWAIWFALSRIIEKRRATPTHNTFMDERRLPLQEA